MDIKTLGKDFEIEKDNLLLYSKYNNQVINIRKQFSVSQLFSDTIYYYTYLIQYLFFQDELQSLFPHVRLDDKDMKLTDAEFNVFVNYITKKLLYYQTELFKQEVNVQIIFLLL